jgi:ankyrin repeat protein
VDDIIDGGITPLACAAYNGSVTSMKTLLQAGANVQISKPIGKAIVADLTSSESMVQILLDSGANADAIDEVSPLPLLFFIPLFPSFCFQSKWCAL